MHCPHAAAVVHFDVTVVDTQTGLWCPSCLLPSGVELRAVVTPRRNPTVVVGRVARAWCDDCNRVLDERWERS